MSPSFGPDTLVGRVHLCRPQKQPVERKRPVVAVPVTKPAPVTWRGPLTNTIAILRYRANGPPYICIGRSVRYAEVTLIHWMKSQQRFSTSE